MKPKSNETQEESISSTYVILVKICETELLEPVSEILLKSLEYYTKTS